jgi:hypothetical protein
VGELDGEVLEVGVGGELESEVLGGVGVVGSVAGDVGGWCCRAVLGVNPGIGADGAGV